MDIGTIGPLIVTSHEKLSDPGSETDGVEKRTPTPLQEPPRHPNCSGALGTTVSGVGGIDAIATVPFVTTEHVLTIVSPLRQKGPELRQPPSEAERAIRPSHASIGTSLNHILGA
jgi:hypothetical protein